MNVIKEKRTKEKQKVAFKSITKGVFLSGVLFLLGPAWTLAEDARTFGDAELDRQIQDQWNSLTTDAQQPKRGKEKQKEKEKGKETAERKDQKRGDPKLKELEYSKLMEELNRDTLLTPVNIDVYRLQEFRGIAIQNRTNVEGFLGVTQTKKGDYRLKIVGIDEEPAGIKPHLFDLENSKMFVKIKHQDKQRLMGYYDHWMNSDLLSVKTIGLKKDFEKGKTFWSRWQLTPVMGEDWYLMKSFYDPGKCMSIKRNMSLVIRSCKTPDERQHWRFVKKSGMDGEGLAQDPNFPIL